MGVTIKQHNYMRHGGYAVLLHTWNTSVSISYSVGTHPIQKRLVVLL